MNNALKFIANGTIALALWGSFLFESQAQSTMTKHKAGHSFEIQLPEYLNKTGGLNNSAAIQFKNTVKDVYGYVIFDTKEELSLIEMKFSGVEEFYETFIQEFLKDEEGRTISQVKSGKNGNLQFKECEVTYKDKEAGVPITFYAGIVETPKSYYKVICWSEASKIEKFRSDFHNVILSIRD